MAIHIGDTRKIYQVAQPCSVEVLLQLDQPLKQGGHIQFQFPNSWSLINGPSYTRKFQFIDPKEAHWQWAQEANIPGVFVTLPADERNPKELTGHHNVYFHEIETMEHYRAIYGNCENPPPNNFHRFQDAKAFDVMIIPHHTGSMFGNLSAGIGSAVDWDAIDDHGLRPVMDIYSHHGQSEAYNPQHFLAYEINRMRNPEHRTNTSVPGPFYAQDYWIQLKRIGVIASSDEHSGQGGRCHGGITVIFPGDACHDWGVNGMEVRLV